MKIILTRLTIRCLTGFCMPQPESLSLLMEAFQCEFKFQYNLMKKFIIHVWFFTCCIYSFAGQGKTDDFIKLFPANNGININPDTHLVLTFGTEPILGSHGQIRIYDASNDKLIDMLDLSIPAGPSNASNRGKNVQPYTTIPYTYVSDNFTNANTKPGTPSGTALMNSDTFQLNIIGRFTDAFHFYPMIIHNKTATIYLHNNLLQYGKTYYAQLDPGVLSLKDGKFKGIERKNWTFTTKKNSPVADTEKLTVSADGSGDFNTVQGAIDFIPDYRPTRTTIYIKNGTYEELVYFRNKWNVTFAGEDRNNVVISYANNEVFNPHPVNVSTNEFPGTFPSRRGAFTCDNSKGILLVNFTVRTTLKGQAEGLLIMGKENIVSHVTIGGSGDALQANGSVYLDNCTIEGDGDTYLGRGPAFFNQCRINSKGAFMWIRNTSANHGAVLLNCTLANNGKTETVIARAPAKNGKGYPYCEAVLINCRLTGITPAGWGPVDGDVSNVHYWELNSLNLTDDKPLDISQRHEASRQLTIGNDKETISNYSTPSFVLDGWTPTMIPVILSQPTTKTVKPGEPAILQVKVASIPEATYQWYKDGKALVGEIKAAVVIRKTAKANDGEYYVVIKNSSGTIQSRIIELKIPI
jgi:pectinesterase